MTSANFPTHSRVSRALLAASPWLLAVAIAGLLLAAASAGQDLAREAAPRTGRVLSVGTPAHGTLEPGRLLSPGEQFAPMPARGSRPAREIPRTATPQPAPSAKRPPGILLM